MDYIVLSLHDEWGNMRFENIPVCMPIQAREPSKGKEHPVKVWQDLQALFSRAAVPAPLPSTPPPRFLEKSISRYHGTSYVTKTSHV